MKISTPKGQGNYIIFKRPGFKMTLLRGVHVLKYKKTFSRKEQRWTPVCIHSATETKTVEEKRGEQKSVKKQQASTEMLIMDQSNTISF